MLGLSLWIGSNLMGATWLLELEKQNNDLVVRKVCLEKGERHVDYEIRLGRENIDELLDILVDELLDYDLLKRYIPMVNRFLFACGFKEIEVSDKELMCLVVEKLVRKCADCDTVVIDNKPRPLHELVKECGIEFV